MAVPVVVSGCACGAAGAAGAALLALLLLPALLPQPDASRRGAPPPLAPSAPDWLDTATGHVSNFDLLLTVIVLLVAVATYLCEWIQRKLMERRIIKLNSAALSSGARLQTWQAAQRRQAGVLRLVREATDEYDLLLHLLLRRAPAAARARTSPHAQHAPHVTPHALPLHKVAA